MTSYNAFSENFTEVAAHTLGDARFKDVIIVLSDDPMESRYLLHKVVLAANSTFFRTLFRTEQNTYMIGSLTKKGFEALIGYFYTQTLTITPKNFDEIKETANYLGSAVEEKMENLGHVVKYSLATVQLKGMETIYIPWIMATMEMD